MPKIQITTDRLPQPERRKGAVLDVSSEKAASLVAQGFAKIIEEDAPQPASEAPAASAPVAELTGELPPELEAPPAPAPEAPARRRRVEAAS